MKKIAALLLTLSLVLSILVPEPAEAKTVQKRFTMRVRELKRLTIKNAKKRVAWKTLSGKNKIRLYKGEKKSVFILAKKKGTVRLQAKIGKKKIVYKITIKEALQKTEETPAPTLTLAATSTPAATPEPTLAPQVTITEQAANYEKEVLRLVNVERSKENLQALKLHSKLSQATAIRANELVESFSHTRPSGERCFTVFKEVGIASYYACGENIAAGQKTPEQVVSGWMNSPGHRANILSAKYRYMGIGYVETTTGMKRYWAQMFMS